MGDIWPEIFDIKSLRLERCIFDRWDSPTSLHLGQISPRKTPKLQSLALFATRYTFIDFGFCLVDLLKELRMEGVWPSKLGSNLTSYVGLHSLHLEWQLFITAASFFPPNLRFISITIPKQIARIPPDYDRFEALLERLSLCLLALEKIRILGHRRYPMLKHEMELRRKLQLQGVRLVVETVYRGEGEQLSCHLIVHLSIGLIFSSSRMGIPGVSSTSRWHGVA